MSEKIVHFTQVPNAVLETLCRSKLTARELKVMLCIIRYTYGFHRDKAELSLSFISEATGIKANKVSQTVRQLVDKNIISKENNRGFIPQKIILAQIGNARNGNAQSGNTLIPQNGNTLIPQNGNQEIKRNKNINKNNSNNNFSSDDPYDFNMDEIRRLWGL